MHGRSNAAVSPRELLRLYNIVPFNCSPSLRQFSCAASLQPAKAYKKLQHQKLFQKGSLKAVGTRTASVNAVYSP